MNGQATWAKTNAEIAKLLRGQLGSSVKVKHEGKIMIPSIYNGLRHDHRMATHAGCGAEYVVFLREWFEGKEIQKNAAYSLTPADGDHLVIEAIWKYSVKFEWRGRVFRVRARWQFHEC